MSSTATKPEAVDAAAAAAEAAAPLPTVAEMRLPTWFFGFEAVIAGAFDLLHAYPNLWPALVVLVAANITVALTVMRRRAKLAKMMWRGKETRRVAFALVGLRLGAHLVLHLLGLASLPPIGHVAVALMMAGSTIALLTYTQRTAIRALLAAGRITA